MTSTNIISVKLASPCKYKKVVKNIHDLNNNVVDTGRFVDYWQLTWELISTCFVLSFLNIMYYYYFCKVLVL